MPRKYRVLSQCASFRQCALRIELLLLRMAGQTGGLLHHLADTESSGVVDFAKRDEVYPVEPVTPALVYRDLLIAL